MEKAIVYTSTNCPHCKQVKSFLNDKGIEFEERNIELEEKYAEEAWNMGVRAVPVTMIGEYKIMGMNMTQFNKALAEA